MRSQRRLVRPEILPVGDPFVFKIDTRNIATGSSNSFSFRLPLNNNPTESALTAYDFTINWGDGDSNYINTWDDASLLHTYATEGIREISINGKLTSIYFNYGTERLKIISIEDFGSVNLQANQSNAFNRCYNLASLPATGNLDFITNGNFMFSFCSFPNFPNIDLPNLVNGNQMFYQNYDLLGVPSNMRLHNLEDGSNMFYGIRNSSLPEGMTLGKLINGDAMFRAGIGNATLPSTLTFASLQISTRMYLGPKVLNIPNSISLPSLTNGLNMFYSSTLPTVDYSNLLIRMNNENPNSNVSFHAGASKYNSSASSARAALVSRGWTITDGGLI